MHSTNCGTCATWCSQYSVFNFSTSFLGLIILTGYESPSISIVQQYFFYVVAQTFTYNFWFTPHKIILKILLENWFITDLQHIIFFQIIIKS